MKNLLLYIIIGLLIISCEREKFNLNNPDIKVFIQQLKNGTYKYYEKGEQGENLWLIMPNFTEHHIETLIDCSKDTSHIQDFPINPVSSLPPVPQGRDYFILGECLLWTVEGIRNGIGCVFLRFRTPIPELSGHSVLSYPDMVLLLHI